MTPNKSLLVYNMAALMTLNRNELLSPPCPVRGWVRKFVNQIKALTILLFLLSIKKKYIYIDSIGVLSRFLAKYVKDRQGILHLVKSRLLLHWLAFLSGSYNRTSHPGEPPNDHPR